MRPPRPLARRLAVFVAAGLALAACRRSPEGSAVAPPAAPPPPAQPALSLPPPVVNRAELVLALDSASSAYAAGAVDETPDLSGRRFVVRQAFGCSGPTPPGRQEAGLAAWRHASNGRTIELTLQPADWKRWAPAGETDRPWDAVEGFWLARPWLRGDGCPAQAETTSQTPGAAAPVAPLMGSPQTAGLAAVFEPGGSRVGRRSGRAFTHTIRIDEGARGAPTAGYRVVLEGRFTSFAGGRAIRCLSTGPDVRPVCIAAANVDGITFESSDGEVLTEWRSG